MRLAHGHVVIVVPAPLPRTNRYVGRALQHRIGFGLEIRHSHGVGVAELVIDLDGVLSIALRIGHVLRVIAPPERVVGKRSLIIIIVFINHFLITKNV